MNAPDQVAGRLKSAGMKITSPRMAICRHLHGNPSHPTAEEILAALRPEHPGLSLSTVYNTLQALEQVGEIKCVHLAPAGDRRHERRFDPLTEPHDHAVCRACGRIEDVVTPAAARAPARALPGGFAADSQHVVF